jgi:hypothetical protein
MKYYLILGINGDFPNSPDRDRVEISGAEWKEGKEAMSENAPWKRKMRRFVHLCIEAEIDDAGETGVWARVIHSTYLVDKSKVEWQEGDPDFKKGER